MCLAAVKENGYVLQFVKNQTPEIYLEAVKKDGYALQFVKNQTPEICLAAIKKDGYALQFVKKQTPELLRNMIDNNIPIIREYINIDLTSLPDDIQLWLEIQ